MRERRGERERESSVCVRERRAEKNKDWERRKEKKTNQKTTTDQLVY